MGVNTLKNLYLFVIHMKDKSQFNIRIKSRSDGILWISPSNEKQKDDAHPELSSFFLEGRQQVQLGDP